MAQHAFAKVVVIREMLLFFGNDKTCCATGPQSQKPTKKRYRGLSQTISGMTREVQKNIVFAIETGFGQKNDIF